MPAHPTVVLYSRPGCHLCDDARAALSALLADRRARGLGAPAVEERNIETDEGWERAFGTTIPVVEVGERRLELAVSPARLRRLLDETLGTATTSPTAAG
ncbi:MAG: glutaredoxin family protein [Chloroflexota bacterium]